MNFHDERDNLLREDAVLAAHEQAGGPGRDAFGRRSRRLVRHGSDRESDRRVAGAELIQSCRLARDAAARIRPLHTQRVKRQTHGPTAPTPAR